MQNRILTKCCLYVYDGKNYPVTGKTKRPNTEEITLKKTEKGIRLPSPLHPFKLRNNLKK
ncbi:hypothetical protein SAMN02927921_03462 [Sinomicrobium oceani]|uniref:Uncharacterized protein n=1 Tax=Sinomicrobium oceani TaxID=1150368 RepID=A0A1K1RDT0_9FLAO|nr:hypothetical protein SAMN02927921_03462 [Sinomicrobium oceani]